MSGYLCKAKLTQDIIYRDFTGRRYVQSAGTEVEIFQRLSQDWFATDEAGKSVSRPDTYLIAVHGTHHFTVEATQLSVF